MTDRYAYYIELYFNSTSLIQLSFVVEILDLKGMTLLFVQFNYTVPDRGYPTTQTSFSRTLKSEILFTFSSTKLGRTVFL